MGCLSWIFMRNRPRYNGTTLYHGVKKIGWLFYAAVLRSPNMTVTQSIQPKALCKKFHNGEINERSFSNPHPRTGLTSLCFCGLLLFNLSTCMAIDPKHLQHVEAELWTLSVYWCVGLQLNCWTSQLDTTVTTHGRHGVSITGNSAVFQHLVQANNKEKIEVPHE